MTRALFVAWLPWLLLACSSGPDAPAAPDGGRAADPAAACLTPCVSPLDPVCQGFGPEEASCLPEAGGAQHCYLDGAAAGCQANDRWTYTQDGVERSVCVPPECARPILPN